MMNQPIFEVGDPFLNYKDVEKKLDLYLLSTHYEFNTLNSVKLVSLKNNRISYNEDLIYDDKYFKCVVNPKPSALREFIKKNPGVVVKLCPAHLTLRTTKDKQALTVTKFVPNHDHDPSNKMSRLQEAKDKISKNIIHGIKITHCEEINELSASSSTANLQNERQIHSSVITGSNDKVTSSILNVASELTADEMAYAPVIDDDDDNDFNILLKKLHLNIASSANKEEQTNKIRMLTSMMNKIDVTSKIGSLSVYLSRSRGRNRDRKNRIVGLSASSRNMLTFDELSVVQKKIYLIKLILIDKSLINNIITKSEKIVNSNLTHLTSNMPDALGSETIKFELLEEFFEKEAFNIFKKLINEKRESPQWTCNQCDENLGTSDSIECDKCLFWSHFICVDLVQEPPNNWFCPKCKAQKK